MSGGFQQTLDYIRSIADSEAHRGRLFERLMKAYLLQDPLYKERFSSVWLWAERVAELDALVLIVEDALASINRRLVPPPNTDLPDDIKRGYEKAGGYL